MNKSQKLYFIRKPWLKIDIGSTRVRFRKHGQIAEAMGALLSGKVIFRFVNAWNTFYKRLYGLDYRIIFYTIIRFSTLKSSFVNLLNICLQDMVPNCLSAFVKVVH